MKVTRKKTVMLIALAVVIAVFAFAENLIFEGWSFWGGVQAVAKGNTVTLNGRVNTGGYVTEYLSPNIKGKTVTLEIRNAGNSRFSEGRLMKITVNKNDRLVRPANIPNLVNGEYIPSNVTRVEFTLPNDFDGKLGFVFYQADLKDLNITATYR